MDTVARKRVQFGDMPKSTPVTTPVQVSRTARNRTLEMLLERAKNLVSISIPPAFIRMAGNDDASSRLYAEVAAKLMSSDSALDVQEDIIEGIYSCIPKIKCKGFCRDQCTVIPVHAAEARVIRRRGAQLPMIASAKDPWCGNLTVEGRCRDYENRPTICRVWHAMDDVAGGVLGYPAAGTCMFDCSEGVDVLKPEEMHLIMTILETLSLGVIDIRIGGADVRGDFALLKQWHENTAELGRQRAYESAAMGWEATPDGGVCLPEGHFFEGCMGMVYFGKRVNDFGVEVTEFVMFREYALTSAGTKEQQRSYARRVLEMERLGILGVDEEEDLFSLSVAYRYSLAEAEREIAKKYEGGGK